MSIVLKTIVRTFCIRVSIKILLLLCVAKNSIGVCADKLLEPIFFRTEIASNCEKMFDIS